MISSAKIPPAAECHEGRTICLHCLMGCGATRRRPAPLHGYETGCAPIPNSAPYQITHPPNRGPGSVPRRHVQSRLRIGTPETPGSRDAPATHGNLQWIPAFCAHLRHKVAGLHARWQAAAPSRECTATWGRKEHKGAAICINHNRAVEVSRDEHRGTHARIGASPRRNR
jgi:hypothetical protein